MPRKNTRIEPTFSADEHSSSLSSGHHHTNHIQSQNSANYTRTQNVDFYTQLLNYLTPLYQQALASLKSIFSQAKYQKIALAFTFLLITLIALMLVFSPDENPVEEITNTQTSQNNIAPVINSHNRSHELTLPDNFSLMATDHNGMVIHWQADSTNTPQLWDIHTAEGDDNCQQATFNNGENYRTLNVLVEDQQLYFAYFSPLDTREIVKAIALRGNFSLCGYKFSLKGSQAALGKHYYYSELLSY